MLPAMVPVTVNYKRNADLQRELREKVGGWGSNKCKAGRQNVVPNTTNLRGFGQKGDRAPGRGGGGGGRRGIGADLAYQSSTTDMTNSLETGSAITNCRDLAYRVVILFSFIHAFPSPPPPSQPNPAPAPAFNTAAAAACVRHNTNDGAMQAASVAICVCVVHCPVSVIGATD